MDGHDKLMGSQNSTFPLTIYGAVDTASRKILTLRIWKTNSEPGLVGKWYLDLLHTNKVLPHHIRIDKGTETTAMATIHAYLRGQQASLESRPFPPKIFGGQLFEILYAGVNFSA